MSEINYPDALADEFDIDVDISPLLGNVEGVSLIDDRWYRMAAAGQGRDPVLRAKAQRMLDNSMFNAQWAARGRRRLDRRRAVRAPLISRVRLGNGKHLTATDISLSGLRCAGEPVAPLMNVEFKVPGLGFPVDARVEVMSYKESNVIPLVGLRFIHLERPYAEEIARYIAERRERVMLAA